MRATIRTTALASLRRCSQPENSCVWRTSIIRVYVAHRLQIVNRAPDQEPGPADAELGRDPRSTIRGMLFGASGEGVAAARAAAASGRAPPSLGMVPKGGGFLQGPGAPAALPAWLTESDVDFYAAEFKRTGFTGALNWYRNFDRNWELQGALQGAAVTVPALYVAGDSDFVATAPGMDRLLANLKRFVPALRDIRMIAGCGHWTQQERPNEVNAAIIEFIRSLPS